MIVIDTNILVWLTTSPRKISPKAIRYINRAKKKNEVFVSAFSIWEIAMLEKKNRLVFKFGLDKWLEGIKDLTFLKFKDVDMNIALDSVNLEWSNKDPADRIIIATARQLGAKLITSDKRILRYKQAQAIW